MGGKGLGRVPWDRTFRVVVTGPGWRGRITLDKVKASSPDEALRIGARRAIEESLKHGAQLPPAVARAWKTNEESAITLAARDGKVTEQ
jgi:cytosine/adenosine deaminase-related metal-dependent hydrolase